MIDLAFVPFPPLLLDPTKCLRAWLVVWSVVYLAFKGLPLYRLKLHGRQATYLLVHMQQLHWGRHRVICFVIVFDRAQGLQTLGILGTFAFVFFSHIHFRHDLIHF